MIDVVNTLRVVIVVAIFTEETICSEIILTFVRSNSVKIEIGIVKHIENDILCMTDSVI